MKNATFQVLLGLLLAVSTGLLTVSAATLDRVQDRLDRLENKVDAHWEKLTIQRAK